MAAPPPPLTRLFVCFANGGGARWSLRRFWAGRGPWSSFGAGCAGSLRLRFFSGIPVGRKRPPSRGSRPAGRTTRAAGAAALLYALWSLRPYVPSEMAGIAGQFPVAMPPLGSVPGGALPRLVVRWWPAGRHARQGRPSGRPSCPALRGPLPRVWAGYRAARPPKCSVCARRGALLMGTRYRDRSGYRGHILRLT